MRAKIVGFCISVLSVLACGAVAHAHHGRASYGSDRVTLQATVTDFRFINPHVQLYFDITSAADEIEHWQGELTAPNKLARAGWTKSTFQAGDKITISGRAARNDGHSVAIDEIITADGETMPLWEILD
jgi:hypothetical protein